MKTDKNPMMAVAAIVFSLIIVGILALFTSCQKEDMEIAEILPQSCRDCHGDSKKYPVFNAKAGYEVSGHKVGGNAFYSNGSSCQKCHTHEGFIEFVETGTVDADGFIPFPSQPSCFTCHEPHAIGNFDLRINTPVILANGEEFNGGKGNLCANCHQSRANAAQVVVPAEASEVSSRFGPHHGPQGDLFAGTNTFEFAGKNYADSPHTEKITDSCTVCHMTYPEGRFSLSPGVAGHSFNIEGEVHERGTLNTAGCLECHPDIGSADNALVFDMKASEDYDLDGTFEPFQFEVQGLLDRFLNDEGTGYLQTMEPPFYNESGSWQRGAEGERPVEQMAALFNYKFFVEDRSLGLHNPKYTIQVLYDTIEKIDPDFDVGYRPE